MFSAISVVYPGFLDKVGADMNKNHKSVLLKALKLKNLMPKSSI